MILKLLSLAVENRLEGSVDANVKTTKLFIHKRMNFDSLILLISQKWTFNRVAQLGTFRKWKFPQCATFPAHVKVNKFFSS
jgi:hypothetical protein